VGGYVTRPQSIYLWIYVEGNPITRIDPIGRCYGQFNFMRTIPVAGKICKHLDQAMFIYELEGIIPREKTLRQHILTNWQLHMPH
jgi:hypothetical protein